MAQHSPQPEVDLAADGRQSILRTTSLREMFSIDLRALAVLRILVGGLVLLDLFQRIKLFPFFYGEFGFLNRATSQALTPPAAGFWSLYWLSDHPWLIAALMVLAAVAAVGMIFGFRSREMTLLTLVLFWSLNVRNPLVTTAGHVLLRMLIFWMIFLPIGAVWSIDAKLRKKAKSPTEQPRTAFSLATVAILIQIAAMYFFSGIAKWNEDWFRGDALQIALQLNLYVKPLGHWLSGYPTLTTSLTYVTFVFELIGPLLLFMPWGNRFWRVFFACAFFGMHIGVWLTMSIGIFSLVAVAAWSVLIPAEVWQLKSWRRYSRAPSNGGSQPIKSQNLPIWANAICLVILVYVLALNGANVQPQKSQTWFPPLARAFGNATMVVQEFKMFARPSHQDFWFELRQVESRSGKHVAVLAGPDRQQEDIQDPATDSIYQSIDCNHFRRLLHALFTYPTLPAEREFMTALRRRLAVCWVHDELRKQSQSDDSKSNHYQLNCFYRTIDLDFPNQAANHDTWAQGQLLESK